MAVVVLCPMEIERKAVERAVRSAPGVRVVQTGIGKAAIVRALAEATLGIEPGSLFVLAGACGGLIASDDVPAIAVVVDEHGGRWTPRFAEPGGVTLVAVDRVVATPGDKRVLAERTGGSIVDMETHAFAAECERRGLAWTVVRGVSDSPEETLPAEVLGWIRPDGGTRAWRAALDLAWKPSLIRHVVGVMRRTNRVLPAVGERVLQFTARWDRLSLAEKVVPSGAGQVQCLVPISPLPVPRSVPLIILFGGTFDPPHRAHIELPLRVRDVIEKERGIGSQVWVVFIPAAISPHKESEPVASDVDRVAMLRSAIDGLERVGVWEDEILRARAQPGRSYTVETLERARAWLDANGGQATKLVLLIGADQAGTFHRWKDPRKIIGLADPVVMVRGDEGADADEIIALLRAAEYWTSEELAAWRRRVIAVGRIDVSATAIRSAIRSGCMDEVSAAVPESVLDLIRSRGLYGAGNPRK